MKNFVLLIVPPVAPPLAPAPPAVMFSNVLNRLHNFTPVGFYGHVSAQPPAPPEHPHAARPSRL